jgi:N-acetylglucosamine malate deacetylase 1
VSERPPIMPEIATELPRGPVLVLAPHPDDEIMGPGGTLLRHVAQGDAISIVVIFDGQRGDPEGRFPREGYVARRQEESRAVARRFLATEDLVFHGFEDGLAEGDLDIVYPGLPEDPEAKISALLDGLATLLKSHVERVRPRVIYYPWAGEFHSDHWALATAFERLRRNEAGLFDELNCDVLAYEVWSTLLPETLVDVSATMKDKLAAMALYETQVDYVNYPELIGGLNRHRGFLMPQAVAPLAERRAEAFLGRYRQP